MPHAAARLVVDRMSEDKLDNVLIADYSTAKIYYFGESRAKANSAGIAASPVFAAPKVMRGEA